MPYMESALRRKSRWRRYNQRRAADRALDAERRLARAAEKREAYLAAFEEPIGSMVKVSTPLFMVTIRCRDGARGSLAVRELPWGLSISPTLVGRKIAAILRHYRPAA